MPLQSDRSLAKPASDIARRESGIERAMNTSMKAAMQRQAMRKLRSVGQRACVKSSISFNKPTLFLLDFIQAGSRTISE